MVNRKNIVRCLAGLLCLAVLSAILMYAQAFADGSEGGNTGGGGINGCSQTSGLWTCYGATWRYYTTDSDDFCTDGYANTECGDSYTSSDTYALKGHITGCKKYGGYWRYAMVRADGSHEQRGVIGIGGNSSVTFDSEFFYYSGSGRYGGMNYIPPTAGDGLNANNANWNDVKAIYEALQEKDPVTFWHGWNKDSNLAWFCGPDNVDEVDPEHTLTVEGKNIYNNGDINDGDNSATGTGLVSVTRKDLWSSNKYKFIGWKDSGKASSGMTDLVTTTSTSSSVYISNASTDKYDTGSKTVYNTFNVRDLTEDKTVYAYYAPGCTLTVSAGTGTSITVERTKSLYSLAYTHTWPGAGTPWALYKGDELKITFTVNNGYTLTGHTVNGTSFTSGETYTVGGSSTCTDTTIATTAVRNEFEGMSRVGSGGGWDSTGWKNTSDTKTRYVSNCDPVNGCKVQFEHNLRRTAGDGTVTYSITRTSNYSSVSNTTLANNLTASFTGNNVATTVRSASDSEVTLYPGQVVCENLSFAPNIATSRITLTVCASALGNAQSGEILDIKVKNDDVEKYNDYMDVVYAKPSDDIGYRATYRPTLQYTYNLKPQKIQINGGTVVANSSSVKLGDLFNSNKGSLKNWNNGFTLHADPSATFAETDHTYNLGSTVTRQQDKAHTVTTSDVGKELVGYAKTNKNEAAKTTPSQVTFINSSGDNLAQVSTAAVEDSAKAVVPYNFRTGATIDEVGNDEVAYAGEKVAIDYTVDVLPKTNSETTDGSEDEAYATIVREAKEKLIYYISGSGTSGPKVGTSGFGNKDIDLCIYYGITQGSRCGYMKDSSNITLNASGNMEGSTVSGSTTANVPDSPAGTQICVAMAVYPSTSGADTNISKDGDGKWTISDSKCFIISKRPSFQVWGGSLYSAAAIKAPASAKNNLSGITGYEYNVSNTNNTIVFGSWVEQSVIAGGLVNGLASGAATGLLNNAALNSLGITAGSPEGRNVSYCNNRVPLSLANYSNSFYNLCPYVQLSGNAGITTTTDRESLIDYLTSEDLINTGATGEGTTTNIVYESNTTDLTIGTTTTTTIIPQGTTRIITAPNNTITINGNIEYANYNATTSYTTLTTIPKLIIYANDIIIACNVNRIDAILIAKNNVNTCNSNTAAGETINDRKNSNPLTINGVIITNTLDLNRTYGATTGAGSSIPAEIINYDTSTILWGRDMANTDNYTGLTSVYQHELAPRY